MTIHLKNKLPARILALLFIMSAASGCYVTRTVSTDDLAVLQKKRSVIRLHSGDRSILLVSCRLNENVLTGEVADNPEEIKPGDVSDVYIAPAEALNIDGNLVSVPVVNIGKVDYRGHDVLSITTGSILAFLFFVLPGLWAM
jgi:hypothetical protein